MAEPALTTKEKLLWYDALTFDVALSHLSARVAHAIGTHLNRWSGATFISHDTLAKRLGVSPKSIERAVAELERRGHLSVTRSKGRGYANVYRAIIPNGAPERSDDPVTRNPTPLSKKPDNAVRETRQQSLSYPSILPNIITHKKEDRPSSPPAINQQKAQVHHEPEIVRQARLQEQGEQRNIEATLADRLTIGGDIDGHEVLLNVEAQQLAILTHRLRHDELTTDDIVQAQTAFRAARSTGRVLELMPTSN